ncbi:DedA family protein [Motiliproteus coralliicola]|uniref:DedA family protein n=1 Tax=Motiliproteus coralliicola TaxID=2283196 RepID=A0A369WFY0_9GAMM|nr:YqaA family protein [Motiliproteus coralliicola]RDE19506.1 DedA family protein [Motiliproteus coralliicola]
MDLLPLWGLFSSGFIASTLLPGGSELLLLYLLEQAQHPVWLLVLTAGAGNSLGGLVTWGMGYWLGRRFPSRPLKPRQQQALNWLQRHGSPVLLLSWLPLIGDPLCLISGWLRQPFWLCALMIVAGKLGRYLLLSWAYLGL